jgi:hypothetical protein
MQREVGVIKLTAKLASVLAKKPQLREQQVKNLTHYGITGIIASAFTDLAKKENREYPVSLKLIA